jgi:hypothetical protein
MTHTGATEPFRAGTRRKLFTWGIRATLLIQNGISAAIQAGKRAGEARIG